VFGILQCFRPLQPSLQLSELDVDAGGVELNLQRAASCCINLELPWNPAVLEQRIGRIYRLGQPQPIDVYNLVTEQGIEARIAGLVATKRALFSGLFDGTTDEVQFEGGRSSFLMDVEKLVPEVPDVPGAQGAPRPASRPVTTRERLGHCRGGLVTSASGVVESVSTGLETTSKGVDGVSARLDVPWGRTDSVSPQVHRPSRPMGSATTQVDRPSWRVDCARTVVDGASTAPDAASHRAQRRWAAIDGASPVLVKSVRSPVWLTKDFETAAHPCGR
jgi:hypothetical protein